jgi:two-component system CheB/CheR fusion protein
MKSVQHHYVVAVGASAGGLEAIQEFFDNMPQTDNLSFVIIQHLSPDFKSLLVELVSRHTQMKVVEAAHNQVVVKHCIYVIPNTKQIRIEKNKLVLSEKTQEKVPNNAIDVFLHSLAMDKRQRAVAVILSGTGTDGTRGIATIKEQGGIVLVQDPKTAKFDGMPNSAILSGYADIIGPPADLAAAIINDIRHPEVNMLNTKEPDEKTLNRIFELIYKNGGNDFHYYKTPTILRRISKRMVQLDFKDPVKYAAYLEDHPDECKELAHDFLISVTRFFRDTEAFTLLESKVIPEIIFGKEPDNPLKVWVSACSTGEEAYSIAMLIDKVLERTGKRLDVKIFASDIDASNLEIASLGVYPLAISNDVPADMLSKYFTIKGKGYTISPRIRKQIVFARHDITRDPPFIKNDLVSCRNMLIYMNNVLQDRIYNTLQFALNKDGFLFLGPSENPAYPKGTMTQLSAKWRIFKKIQDLKPRLTFGDNFTSPVSARGQETLTRISKFESKVQRSLWMDARDALTEDLGFIALYIDKNFEVKETMGNYDQLLKLPRKVLNLNLIRMLPQELSLVINKEIRKAWKTNEKVVVNNLTYKKDDKSGVINLLINPVVAAEQDFTLVTITKVEVAPTVEVVPYLADGIDPDYINGLESELQEVRNSLQLAVEDLETANEELQSSNEELLSSNEELQSSNEELQSLNEELYTLNTEHQLKIKELIELNDDLNNYFRSTDIAQIFLDANLNIRKFNPASASMINFIDSDLGRPFTHISNNIRYDKLMEDIEHVQRTKQVVEKEVQLNKGRELLMRIMPYITRDNKHAGIIITFVDITTIANLNNIIRSVFNASQSAILALHTVETSPGKVDDFIITTVNRMAYEWFGMEHQRLTGKSLKNDLPLLSTPELFAEYLQVVKDDSIAYRDIFLEEKNCWYEMTAVKMPGGLVITFTDVTDKKRAFQKIKQNYSELSEVKEHLKLLNVELEDKVRDRTRELSISEERFRLVARATNDAIWDWDLLNDEIWWSDSFSKMFGFQSEDISRQQWAENIHPDDRKEVTDSLLDAVRDNGHQWSREYRLRRAGGAYASILDRGYILYNDEGKAYRMLGSMIDLTALKEAEQAVASNIAEKRFLAEAMPLMVWTSVEAGELDFVNSQFEYYTDLQYEDAIGKGWQRVIHPHDLEVLLSTWEDAEEDHADFKCEIRILSHGDQYRWNLLRAKARKGEDEKFFSWVITNMDVHEQKVMNEILEEKVAERTVQLQKSNMDLESSNNDLQLFASVASHDLQEPLRKIHMFSKMVRDKHDKELPESTVLYLNKIMHSVNRMKSLMVNILHFSKLTTESAGFEWVDLNELLAEVQEDFEMLVKEKNATIIVSELPVIMANKSQIQQVFQNLIGNSLKFTSPEVPPVIRISAQCIEEKSADAWEAKDGKWCRLSIVDNGIGFDEQFKSKIFDLFQRLNSKDTYEGTGIGLAIIKKIVEKHQGLITAESKAGEGASFHIILPVEQEF